MGPVKNTGCSEFEQALPRYEILQEEGTGLFRVRDRDTDAIRALYVLRESVDDLEGRVALLRQLDHPNIVRLFEAGDVDGLRYVVAEYAEGRSLGEVRLQPREALRVVEQVSAALGAAYDAGVPLGAVSPSSIRIDAEGHARIVRPVLTKDRLDLGVLADTLHRALTGKSPAADLRSPATSHASAQPRSPAIAFSGKLAAVVVAAAVILLASFLPWAHLSLDIRGDRIADWGSGWTTGIHYESSTVLPNWLALTVGILLGVIALVQIFMQVPASWLVYLCGTGYGAVHLLAWLIFVLSIEPIPNQSIRIGIGTLLALLAFLGMGVAAIFMRPRPAARPRRPVARRVRRKRKSRS